MQQQATPPSAMATPPVSMYSSETATYVNVVSPSARVPVAGGGQQQHMAPPPYPQPPPTNNMMPRPPLYAAPGQHPGSGGHVPYSPVFSHHQHHIRPVGIANVMPRQGSSTASTMNNNQHENNNTQRQSSVGNDEKSPHDKGYLLIFNKCWNLRWYFFYFCRTDGRRNHSSAIQKAFDTRPKQSRRSSHANDDLHSLQPLIKSGKSVDRKEVAASMVIESGGRMGKRTGKARLI